MSHPLGLLFIAAVVVLLIAIALWNFVPSWRSAMKGYTTVLEGLIGLVLSILAPLTGALQDAQAAGYIPPQIAAYVPIVFFVYLILKRFGTSSPVGQKY